MKFIAAVLAFATAVTADVELPSRDISASSALGRKLISKARKLQNNYNYGNNFNNNAYGNNGNNGNNNANQNYNEAYNQAANDANGYAGAYGANNAWMANGNGRMWWQDFNMGDAGWLAGYSIKFQGCHHVSQWNDEAEDEEDVRVLSRRLVRFRLCPTDLCFSNKASGCDSQYGDYLIDMETYLEAYVEAKETYDEWMEEQNRDWYNNAQEGYDYQEYYENEAIDPTEYTTCQQTGYEWEDNNYYQNEDGDEGGALYVGPYCASQGGAIYLGAFKDDQCTIFADSDGGRNAFFQASGSYLPFSSTNMIELDCFPCNEPDQNNYDGNDQYDEDDVAEVCENLYTYSGKCEQNLPDYMFNSFKSANNKACNYIEGIKVIRKDGAIVTTNRSAPATVSPTKSGTAMFAGFFGAFILLSAYTFHLKQKFERAALNFSE